MAKKKPFALRISPQVMTAMQRWADDDLRSLNAQIEWVLREGLRKSGRLKKLQVEAVEDDEEG
ncbi:MAG: Arc family DNA binding domain-containing protein [Pseudomonadota bacterium]